MAQIDETAAEPMGGAAVPSTPPASTAPAPSRTLRVAMTLQPVEAGYRALLAVGADDVDPLLQQVDVVGWPALAEALQDLADAAAIRWRDQPRNPAFGLPPKPTPTPKHSSTRATAADSAGPATGDGETPPAVEDDAAPSGQLALFDPGG